MLKKKIAKEDIQTILKVVITEISSVADYPGNWVRLSKNSGEMFFELTQLESAEGLLAFYGLTFNGNDWVYSGRLRVVY